MTDLQQLTTVVPGQTAVGRDDIVRLLTSRIGQLPAGQLPAGQDPTSHGPAAHGPAAHGPAAHGPAAHGPAAHGPAAHGPAAHGPAGRDPAGHGRDHPSHPGSPASAFAATSSAAAPPATPATPIAPTTPPRPATAPHQGGPPSELPAGVGRQVIEALRAEVCAELSRRDPDGRMAGADRQTLARSLIASGVAGWAARYAQGRAAVSPAQEAALGAAVLDAIGRGGRLQTLLDEEGVEDVLVDGPRATVEYVHRPRRVVEGVADSPEQLVAWVNHMAQLSGRGAHLLTPASPVVGFRLPDGSRATASLLTTRPSVAVRKHRLRGQGIGELLRWGSLNNVLAHFLTACVTARLNTLVVGSAGAGKTSLLRALAREIPPQERLVTLESDRELYLDEPGPRPGPTTFAFETGRPHHARRDENHRPGEPAIGDLLATALRYNASRVIVGELRSADVLPVLQAMSGGGAGSMSTLQVRRPTTVVPRLVQLCAEAGLAHSTAHELVAASIDVIVHLGYLDETASGGRRHRFISHVHEVHDAVDATGRAVVTEVFAPVPGEPRAVFQTLPGFIDDLERQGFRREWLTHQPHTHWGAPLETVKPR